MKVFRVEDDEGNGMYNGWCALQEMQERERHPIPGDDWELMSAVHKSKIDERCYEVLSMNDPCEAPDELLFGFASMEQLRFWIYKHEWIQRLKDEGFKLSVYEVEDGWAAHGRTQAVFIKDKATLINQIELE